MAEYRGDGDSFERNWSSAKEAHYLHWTGGEPENQIQLAFRQHWRTFQELLPANLAGKRVLEVGCGRGSLSAYFADAGWDCTLLDISPAAISLARAAFSAHGLNARFEVGDCLDMPFETGAYDLVFSIGLLEHFEEIESAIAEQVRILAPNGLFIGYVVPHIPENVQKDYGWICDILRAILPLTPSEAKTPLFRSDELSPPYLAAMGAAGLKNVGASGTYPLPMISNSPDFPFTLLPPDAEHALVKHFEMVLKRRHQQTGKNPWLCKEGDGQAFLVWGQKA
ncbi:SAM-dependent methyltransferase [Rhizobium sp. BK619]|uniref:class I SAM-dependent methyltransferase n=1 Tax=Rhizobium sp. BK619 TaxID=2586989 RepID=UPI00160CD23A|nr:class I SAM-dependent methyltransferase [Rhizobium sp. BK619]MBB3648321.1 SAM-dependent methyltransferase [Rhizobium sp. BK619]